MQYKKLGRYELLRVLGKGAMGVVYEGRDPNLDRRVAIKTIMVDDLGPNAAAEYEARFRIEARSAARLQHPNIVTVYDSDRHGDTAFLVMEFIQGEDLKHHLDRGLRPPPLHSLQLVCDLLAALDFAHRQGVVHRDIKPANLLIEADGRVKLTDFGVARISGEATRTQGSMIGTLKYMAPEQVQGLKVDTRADLFSAAIVAYQLFTGVRPFEGDNDFTIIHQIIGQAPELPSKVEPTLPAALDTVLLRALAKNRDERYQTAGEFSAALQEAFGTTVAGLTTQPGRMLPGFATGTVTSPGLPTMATPTTPGLPSMNTLPGTAINQELELEYWRAVRDSTDPKDLDGFLSRFPQGIYADLARRRLHRLQAEPDPDQTVLRGMTLPPGTMAGVVAPAMPQRAAVTPQESTAPLARAAEPEAAPAPPPSSPPASATPAAGPAGTSAKSAKARRSDDDTVAPAPRKTPVGAIAAVAVAVLGAAAWLVLRPGPAPVADASGTGQPTVVAAAPSVPAAPAIAPAPAPAVAPALASVAAPASAASAATAAKPAARKASSPAVAQKPASSASSVAAAPVGKTEPVPEKRPEPVASAPAAPRLVSPNETCKDKGFLAKPLCLISECEKAEYRSHPVCVRLREEQRQKQLEAERAQQTR